MDEPWLSQRYPRALVRRTRNLGRGECAVEHIRLNSRNDLSGLPGLDGRPPSLVRDAIRTMLSAGVPSVDIVLVRMADAKPWEFHRHDIYQALDPLLADLRGVLLLFPDMGGPPVVGRRSTLPTRVRAGNVLRAMARWSTSWPERFQFALIDALPLSDEDELFFLRRLIGMDCGVCRWSGDRFALRRHGWRSAAAAVAGGIIGLPRQIGAAFTGLSIPLPRGRTIPRDRLDQLTVAPAEPFAPEPEVDSAYIRLALAPRHDRARICSEPTFRRPLGAWPLPSVLVAKLIHRVLIEAAEAFVFSTIDQAQAISLGVSLQRVLGGFHGAGLIVGPDGEGPPLVQGSAVRDPRAPGLSAEVQAQLRPWNQHITVRVAVRPGNRPSLEVV